MSYKVIWCERAREDFTLKVRTRRVAQKLLEVAEEALDDHQPPDGGHVNDHGTLYWRRGLTNAERAELDAAEACGHCLDDGREHGYDFLFVYQRINDGWEILALLDSKDIGWGLEYLY